MNEKFSLLHLEDCVWIVTRNIGLPIYDYKFERNFACRHPPHLPSEGITAVARLGAAQDYEARYRFFESLGIRLIHSPSEYQLASELPDWYPHLKDLTPKSLWYDEPPSVEEIENTFDWPIFIKGQRQTSRHKRRLSIVESPEQYVEVQNAWKNDDILHWQKMVCREFIPLRSIATTTPDAFPKSYEFRCFCWKGRVVAVGNYWFSEKYEPSESELFEITRLAETAAGRLNIPFLVIDIAQTFAGQWLIIECNDGQDSGYAGLNPMLMWAKIVGNETQD